MTQRTKAGFETQFGIEFADNTTRQITPARLRSVQQDIADSVLFLDAAPLNLAALLASNSGDYAENDVITTREEGFRYMVAASDATDHHLTTSGGAKLYAMQGPDGAIRASQLGLGTSNDSTALGNLFSCLTDDRTRYLIIDVDVTLPGQNSSFSFTDTDIPNPAKIEFTNGSRVLFDTDGTVDHDYLKIEGVTGLTLIRPYVKGTTTLADRNDKTAIFLKDCDDCHTFDAIVEDTAGAGILIENCRDCTHTRPKVYRTKADGVHITGGQTGKSVNCWSYDGYAEDTGDDGFAVVSYNSGNGDLCENCGHLDFVTRRAGARGASIVGLDGGKMSGIIHDTPSQGFLCFQDDESQFNSFANSNVDIDVTTYNCGNATGTKAAIQIGKASVGITGRLRSYNSASRGISIGNSTTRPQACSFEVYSYNDAGVGVYCDDFDNLTLTGLHSEQSGEGGASFLRGNGLVLPAVHITDYGQVNDTTPGSYRGLTVNDVDDFYIPGGVIRDTESNSERPLIALNSTNGTIGEMRVSGGSATTKVQISTNCTDVVYDGPFSQAKSGTSVTLDLTYFGMKTTTQFTSASAKTLTIPTNATTALPLNQAAYIVNRGANDLTVSGSGTLSGSTTVPSGEARRLVQVATDVWLVN